MTAGLQPAPKPSLITRTFGGWRRRELYGRGGAIFSPCERYRYALWRSWIMFWGDTIKPLVFVGLNPSTADERDDDPTIRRVIDFACREGCNKLVMLNLFALRSTDPKALYTADDPVGPEHDDVLRMQLRLWQHGPVVAGWGAHGALHGRDAAVARIVAESGRQLLCLGTTKDGHPRHPLYLRKDTPLVPWAAKGGE